MVRLEPRDLVFRPGVETVALERVEFDGSGRIIAPVAVLDCELAKRAQAREPATGGVWRQGIEPLLDPFRRQQCERSITIRWGTQAFQNAPAHPLRARTLRAEELLRIEILGDDRRHAAGLVTACADGSARPNERSLVSSHERRRPGQAGQAHEREAAPTEIIICLAVALIEPRMHVFRQPHCFVSLGKSANHGLSGSEAGLPSPAISRSIHTPPNPSSLHIASNCRRTRLSPVRSRPSVGRWPCQYWAGYTTNISE